MCFVATPELSHSVIHSTTYPHSVPVQVLLGKLFFSSSQKIHTTLFSVSRTSCFPANVKSSGKPFWNLASDLDAFLCCSHGNLRIQRCWCFPNCALWLISGLWNQFSGFQPEFNFQWKYNIIENITYYVSCVKFLFQLHMPIYVLCMYVCMYDWTIGMSPNMSWSKKKPFQHWCI